MANLNYFDHFGLPVSFSIDQGALKKLYFNKSRDLHPDYYTLHDESTQEDMLSQSSYNNQAYNILKDPMKRMKYILELTESIKSENDNTLPQEFLMEMMEINEVLMDLSMDFSKEGEENVRQSIEHIEKSLQEEVNPILERYDHECPVEEDLDAIKDFYFKSRYLWRLKENLNKFASQE